MTKIAKRTAVVSRAELPDGSFVNISDLASLGYSLEDWGAYDIRRATERASRKAADATAAAPVPAQTKARALIEYATSIEALPEAQERPAAASALWAKHTAETMPVERAAAFLRAMPIESAPDAAPAAATVGRADHARFARLIELRILSLNMKADRGNNPAARNEATKLSWAVRTHATTGCSWAAAIEGVGLDARATITSILGT